MASKVEWMSKAKWTPNEIRQATGVDAIENEYMDQPTFAMGDVFLNDLGMGGDANFEDYETANPKI